jgi:3alpha(or 20beta)-hydroxysteroid dehydrogenase
MGRVDGKVALISGGARGMGSSHARALVAEGARVVVGDILDDEGKALAEELGDAGRFVHLDVTQPDQWKAAVDVTLDEFGVLNVLVNNAGIVNGNTLQNFPLADWQKIIDINLTGTFLGMQAAVEPMIAAGSGSIINISSVEGLRGSPGLYGYIASKFGVRGLAKAAALELAPHNIRVNSIHPGLIRTPMTAGIPEDILQIPLGRGAEPGEVSACVIYLASDESSYSTGAEFVVDGGLTVGIPHKTM